MENRQECESGRIASGGQRLCFPDPAVFHGVAVGVSEGVGVGV